MCRDENAARPAVNIVTGRSNDCSCSARQVTADPQLPFAVLQSFPTAKLGSTRFASMKQPSVATGSRPLPGARESRLCCYPINRGDQFEVLRRWTFSDL